MVVWGSLWGWLEESRARGVAEGKRSWGGGSVAGPGAWLGDILMGDEGCLEGLGKAGKMVGEAGMLVGTGLAGSPGRGRGKAGVQRMSVVGSMA